MNSSFAVGPKLSQALKYVLLGRRVTPSLRRRAPLSLFLRSGAPSAWASASDPRPMRVPPR